MIETYKAETEKKKVEIEDLGTKPSVFQAQRCQACGLQLDLPTVHFLCKHSFHQRFAPPKILTQFEADEAVVGVLTRLTITWSV